MIKLASPSIALPSKTVGRLIQSGMLIVAATAGGLTPVVASGAEHNSVNSSVRAAERMTVSTHLIPDYFDVPATLEAVNQSTISAQTSGRVLALHADVNDTVEKGALLIELDNAQQQAQLAQANAQLASATATNSDAQKNLFRSQRLHQQGSLSQGQLDAVVAQSESAEAAVRAASAAVEQAQLSLAYTRITAPYSGIVTSRMVEVGELVNPGTPLMSGLALSPLRAVADIPQRFAQQITDGQVQVLLSSPLGDQIIRPSQVTRFPYASQKTHSMRIRALLDELPAHVAAQLMPGMWATVRLEVAERSAILIPATALVSRSEVTAVYLASAQGWRLRQVRVGNSHNGLIEVLSGLAVGDVIAVDGYAVLADVAGNPGSTEPADSASGRGE